MGIASRRVLASAVRILDGLGSAGFEENVDRVVSWLPLEACAELGELCAVLPGRMAGLVRERLARERPASAA